MKCAEPPNKEKTRKAPVTVATEENSKSCEKGGYTHITADLFHVPIPEKELGNLLRGPLQQPVRQGNISAAQPLLLWNV